jgi:hypothetical protein
VGRVAFVLLVGSVVGLGLVAGAGRASLYSPDDLRFLVPVGADGKAQALDFDEFKRRLAMIMNARDDRTKADGKVNSDRAAFLERIDRVKGKKLSAVETVSLTADLVRVGRMDEALNRVKPLVRQRNPSYFAFTTLAHVHAERGEWREAVAYQVAAMLDAEMPAEVKGMTKPQRDWIAKLDRDYVRPYYQLKESTVTPRPDPADEDLYPLFPVAERGKPHDPVRFVNDAGVYQPGALAAAERAKLPPDAIAIVQQLMLWYPTDTRLYWLLAELYAAEGQFGPARDIMDVSVSEARQYGNRKILVDHRAAVRAAADAQPRKATEEPLLAAPASAEPAAPEPVEKQPISMRTIWIYFGVVGLIALLAFIRAMSRRVKGDCGPAG